MIDVHDNFLSNEELQNLKENTLNNVYFPWYYSNYKVSPGDNIVQFTHMFYENHNINSEHYKFLQTILNKINPSAIRRIKANMTYREKDFKDFDLHTDFSGNFENQKTGIFYMNTNNGKTVFENGEKIDSVENRMVIFPANLKHAGTTHTDTSIRCVINFNWY